MLAFKRSTSSLAWDTFNVRQHTELCPETSCCWKEANFWNEMEKVKKAGHISRDALRFKTEIHLCRWYERQGDFQHFLSGIARLDQPFLLLYEQFPFHMAAAHSLGYGSRTGRCTRVYQKQINYNRSGRRAALMHVKYRAGFVFQYSLCLPLGHESSRSILLVKPARNLLILTYAPDLDNKSWLIVTVI